METLPSTRREALEIGARFYFTGKACRRGHTTERRTKTGGCVGCEKRPERRAQKDQYQKNNRDKAREYCRAFAAKNREKLATKSAQFRTENPHYQSAWEKANTNKRRRYSANYRAAKMSATPPWLTAEQREAIAHVYETCPPDHDVDHIVPLQGVAVCGLHVPWNLQHLPASTNRSKGNKL